MNRLNQQEYLQLNILLMKTGIGPVLMFFGKDGSMIENRNKIHSWTWSILPDGMVRELRYNLADEEVVMNPFCPFYELRFTIMKKVM